MTRLLISRRIKGLRHVLSHPRVVSLPSLLDHDHFPGADIHVGAIHLAVRACTCVYEVRQRVEGGRQFAVAKATVKESEWEGGGRVTAIQKKR